MYGRILAQRGNEVVLLDSIDIQHEIATEKSTLRGKRSIFSGALLTILFQDWKKMSRRDKWFFPVKNKCVFT